MPYSGTNTLRSSAQPICRPGRSWRGGASSDGSWRQGGTAAAVTRRSHTASNNQQTQQHGPGGGGGARGGGGRQERQAGLLIVGPSAVGRVAGGARGEARREGAHLAPAEVEGHERRDEQHLVPIDAPCTQFLRHGDPMHASKGLTRARRGRAPARSAAMRAAAAHRSPRRCPSGTWAAAHRSDGVPTVSIRVRVKMMGLIIIRTG
jgi:hypothetical protein